MVIKNWIIYITVMIGLAVFTILYIKQSGFIVFVMAAVVPPVYSVILYALSKRSVKVTFFQDMQSVEKGSRFEIPVCIENNGAISRDSTVLLFFTVCDGLGAHSRSMKKKIYLGSAREEILLSFVPEHCGFYEVRLEGIKLYQGFSLLRSTVRAEARTSFLVMPEYREFPIRIEMDGEEREGESDCYSAVKAGNDPSELFDIRYYRPGDRLNCINWKLSAKKQEMVVQDYGFSIACDTAVFLDLANEKDPDKIEKAIEILYFTAMQLVMAKRLFYVIWNDAREQKLRRRGVREEEDLSHVLIEVMRSGMTNGSEPIEDLYSAQFDGEYLFACIFIYSGRKQLEDEIVRDRLRTNSIEFVQVQKGDVF